MRWFCVLAGVVAASCSLSKTAAAQGSDPSVDGPPHVEATAPPPPPFEPVAVPRVWTTSSDDDELAARGRWYGWQLCIGFAASDAALLTSGASAGAGGGGMSAGLAVAGLAGHALTGPILHWSHGHALRGFASLGLNVGGTLLGGLFGAGLGSASGGDNLTRAMSGAVGAFFGGALGLVTANIVDVSALAYDDGKPQGVVGSLHLTPLVAPRAGGLGVAGAF